MICVLRLSTLAAGHDEYEYVSDCSHGGIGCVAESTGCRQGRQPLATNDFNCFHCQVTPSINLSIVWSGVNHAQCMPQASQLA